MRRVVSCVCFCAAAAMVSGRPTIAATSAPFTGTAAAIPGTIAASDFDNGGEGVAYHDTTSGNTGGVYRQTDVDLEASTEGGYDLMKVRAGEWLNYTVNIASAGSYTATFRVASRGQGGTFHVEFDGTNVTGAITVPNTGGWQTWQSVSTTVTLSAGTQIAHLVMDSNGASGGIGNLASMTFMQATPTGSTPFTGTAVSLPGVVQAEDFDDGGEGIAYHDATSGNSTGAYRSTDVDIEPAASGGYDVCKVRPGEWLKYSVNVTGTGSYTVNFLVASLGQGGTFHLEMNGVDVTGSVTVPDTGGWQNWQTVSRTVSLTAGPQIARLVMDTMAASVGNFDSIEFVAGTPTPAPTPTGGTINVPAGGDLQAAIDAAQPGDTIVLDAGATYPGSFILRAKGGSSFITIQSSAPASSVPPDGVRVTPANAGQLAKVEGGVAGMAAFITEPGAHHYRLLLLEIVSTYAENQIVEVGGYGLNTFDDVPHDLVFDRCYIHGDPANGAKRGILLNAAATSVINSYISDIKSAESDSQAIGISDGPGPFTIANNYLEASGENVMIGGSDPSIPYLVPSDITISGNTIRKQPGWVYEGWIVKNLIEFKNAQRVTIDGNLIEYCWAAEQQGYAFMITPVNQDGGAPWAMVQHLQFTNNVVRHVASVADVLGIAPNTWTVTNDVVFQNNLFLDVSSANWGGAGVMLTADGGQNIVFDHNTLFTDGTSVVFADDPPTTGFVFTNNVVPDNAWAIMGSNASPGNGTIAMYFPGAIVAANAFIQGSAGGYPIANYFPASWNDVGFSNLAGGDYRLSASSPYVNAATDGGPIGYAGPIVQ
ncbi:MAG TPA: carbohydrate-binding protein [Vicinamibacterales bacterium]|nr:carbohydrate-binding protein [Vicinamibacterales bacterium]